MNIKEELQWNDEKPAVLPVRRTENRNIIAFGLKKDQVLKKHKTSLVTTLIVLQGRIQFVIEEGGAIQELRALDVFEVPCDIYHKVIALEESIFVLNQEK